MQDPKLEDLKHIRQLMERSTRFLSLSGLSGIVAGLIALAGAVVHYIFIAHRWAYRYYLGFDARYVTFTIINFAVVFILALVCAYYFTHKKAKKNNEALWDSTSRRLLLNLAIPLATGGVFCLLLLHHRRPELIAPATLIFYGLALVNGSNFTMRHIRTLGLMEIALGFISAYYMNYGLFFWAIGFGVFHILYGAWMYVKYDR